MEVMMLRNTGLPPNYMVLQAWIPRATVTTTTSLMLRLHTMFTIQVSNYMELSPSEKSLVAQLFTNPNTLWNPMVNYRVNKTSPLASILRHINPVHITPSCFSVIRWNIVHIYTYVFLVVYLLQVLIFAPIRATCAAHFIFFINLIIFSEEFTL
jgi:hypothetical protein